MGKRNKWLAAVKKVLSRSVSNDSRDHVDDSHDKPAKNRRSEQEQGKCMKEKRRWSFGKSMHADPTNQQPKTEPVNDKSVTEIGKRQSKHALAIAAATAAAAEAAVVAAHAAAEVVRLTGHVQACRPSYYGRSNTADWAAVKIQTAFRGYLARKSLRSLRGLVRLQALLKGHTVRRQSSLTLRCMQALVRIQIRVELRRLQMFRDGRMLQKQSRRRRSHGVLAPNANIEMHEWKQSCKSMEEEKATELLKQEAWMKRERALSYAFSHQWRPSCDENAPICTEMKEFKHRLHRQHGWSWIERWIAARTWKGPLFRKGMMRMLNSMEPKEPSQMRKSHVNCNDIPLAESNIKNPSSIERSIGCIQNIMSTKAMNIEKCQAKCQPCASESFGLNTPNMKKISTPTTSNYEAVTPMSRGKTCGKYIRSSSPQGSTTTQVCDESLGSCGASTTSWSTPSLYSMGGARFPHPHHEYKRNMVARSRVGNEYGLLLSSPTGVPNYMVATQSARAKARQLSGSKQRAKKAGDICSASNAHSNIA
ncbi:hypothetical protein KP509_04G092500 [Ceratopteris richardii]|uniref:DUF4005 domain-containing protein n=1 Tax=Ceratopteris richardii TaxID=49495 RepID=A0A8T2V2G1_CERRI|nr:hypothetical protein KP509_04G092500 [Ceratopteris richardii]KAH7440125.1 hypothetical protein KP509_04G092500 [Ceratopteris richardii]